MLLEEMHDKSHFLEANHREFKQPVEKYVDVALQNKSSLRTAVKKNTSTDDSQRHFSRPFVALCKGHGYKVLILGYLL